MHKLLFVIFGLVTILPFAHAHLPPAACCAAQELGRFWGCFPAQAGPLGSCRELGDGRVIDVRISHIARRSRNLMRTSTIPPPTRLSCLCTTRPVMSSPGGARSGCLENDPLGHIRRRTFPWQEDLFSAS
jgi:hypothetical protein